MKQVFKKDLLQEKVTKVVTEAIWKELANLKGQIDTKDQSAAPYHVTTSIYLTGNQVLLGLTKEQLESMIHSEVYSAIYEAGLEKNTIEKLEANLKSEIQKLQWQQKNTTNKALTAENQRLQTRLNEIENSFNELGFNQE